MGALFAGDSESGEKRGDLARGEKHEVVLPFAVMN